MIGFRVEIGEKLAREAYKSAKESGEWKDASTIHDDWNGLMILEHKTIGLRLTLSTDNTASLTSAETMKAQMNIVLNEEIPF